MMETKRLILRPWQESDAEALFRYASDQRGEDVAVTESEKSAAGTEGPVDDIPYAGLVECLEN